MKQEKTLFSYSLIFLLCTIIDRASKLWASKILVDNDFIVTSYLNLSLAWNTGISWSMFSNMSSYASMLLTICIGLIILLFTGYSCIRYFNGHRITFETMVLAGGLSNIVDRITYGAVIDFVDFHMFGYHWPTFNIADVFIVCGIVGIMIQSMFEGYGTKK